MAITVPAAGHSKYTLVYVRVDQFCIECVTRFVLQQRESDALRALLRCTKMAHGVTCLRYSFLGRFCVKYR